MLQYTENQRDGQEGSIQYASVMGLNSDIHVLKLVRDSYDVMISEYQVQNEVATETTTNTPTNTATTTITPTSIPAVCRF